MKNNNKAFVLGMTYNGLGVVRALGRHGVKVYGVDSNKNMPGMFSRYCESLVSPNVEQETDAYLDFLVNSGKKLDKPGVLFPTGDAYVTFVSENRDVLSKYFVFAITELSTMRKLLNKQTQYTLAEKVGVPLPKTFYPESLSEIEHLNGQLEYPAIIKPLYSIEWRKVYGAKKVQLVHSQDELIEAYADIQKSNIKLMIQETVLGPDSNSYKLCAYFNQKSEPVLVFTLKKVRNYPCNFGVGSIVESKRLPEVAELGLSFLKKVKYIGIGSVEFKKDLRDNKLKMIELNSRLWLQNSLAERCGINFPYTQYLDLTGQQVKKQSDFKEGIKWISVSSDFASFRGYRAKGELSLFNWLMSLKGRKIFALFSGDDMKPFFHSVEYGLKYIKKMIRVMKSVITQYILIL